jgi:hypothetical protein
MAVASFTVTPNDPLVNFLIPVPATLYSAGLGVLVPVGEMLLPGDPTGSTELEVKMPPSHFHVPQDSESTAKERNAAVVLD